MSLLDTEQQPDTSVLRDNAYYIFRGKWTPSADQDKLTSFVVWDYMGAAEFEGGAFHRTIKMIRSLHACYGVEMRKLRFLGVDFFCVGCEKNDAFVLAELVLRNEVNTTPSRGLRKERTRIAAHLAWRRGSVDRHTQWQAHTDCWLNIARNMVLKRTQEPLYDKHYVDGLCMFPGDKYDQPFRPFFLTTHREAAQAFLRRMDVTE